MRAKSKNIKLQIHHSSMHNAVETKEKHFQISTLAPEIFSLLPICLTADSTAGEPRQAWWQFLTSFIVYKAQTVFFEVGTEINHLQAVAVFKNSARIEYPTTP